MYSLLPTIQDPSLNPLLSNNLVPDGELARKIAGVVADEQARLDALDSRILSLTTTLSELAGNRDRLAEHLRRHKAIISPVRRVPPELLCEIFASAMEEPDKVALGTLSDDGGSAWKAFDPPWYLGHICRAWRDAALAYAPLWSAIVVPCSVGPVRRSKLLPPLEIQLHRSALAPLTIIMSSIEYTYFETNDNYSLLGPTFSHSSRWRTLYLRFDERHAQTSWLLPLEGNLDRLERLAVIDAYDSELPNIFAAAPSLRQVVLADWDLSVYSPDVEIPWEQVTHYCGASDWMRQLEILQAAPKLVDCVIGFGITAPEESEGIVLTLNELRRLRMENPGFLVHLTTPSLYTLHCMLNSEGLLSLLPPFVQRSSCALTELGLWDCSITLELVAVLQALPSLTYLSLESDGGVDATAVQAQIALFDALAITDVVHQLLPNLTSLVYGFPPRFPQDRFFDMARSRVAANAPVPRLKFLRVFSDKYYDCPPAVVTSLESLRAQGCDATFLGEAETNRLKASAVVF